MSDEINVTLFHPPTSKSDAISVPPSTTLGDLSGFAAALLGLDDGPVVLAKGQSPTPLYHPDPRRGNNNADATLASCGVGDGEFISAYAAGEFESIASGGAGESPARQRQRTAAPARPANSNNAAGGLDFSALLGAAPTAPAPPAPPAAGGMDFTALLSAGSSAAATSSGGSSSSSTPAGGPVQWDGMNLDDAIGRNPNPTHLMTILSDTTRHPNILKELNYHNPQVCKKLMAVKGDVAKMAEIWRQTMMKSTTARFLQNHLKQSEEIQMRNALRLNPMDPDANKYFGEKIRLENVQRQYEQMMEEYPESMGRVLMLYMNCLVNEKPLQAFVDSGAQSTIMSSACADRLGLLHLVDDRFSGTAVGVGTGKILGKIHVVEMTVGDHVFPCSITVMDSEAGLGDKNMDCLFGLDMLKRHRCCIDLARNVLRFTIGGGGTMEAPFLHEKDLPTSKGGTMGFDAERENAEIEARLEKMETEENEGGDEKKKEEGGDGKREEGGDGK